MISRLLDAQSVAAANVERVLDVLGTPIILVDRLGKLVHANRAAHAMLERGDSLRMPLHDSGTRATLSPGASAALFLASTTTPRTQIGLLVAALLDFIAAGDTVAEAASALGVSTRTVGSHLLRIFERNDIRRQVDLVKLAAALTMPDG